MRCARSCGGSCRRYELGGASPVVQEERLSPGKIGDLKQSPSAWYLRVDLLLFHKFCIGLHEIVDDIRDHRSRGVCYPQFGTAHRRLPE